MQAEISPYCSTEISREAINSIVLFFSKNI
nr:MAG TPA: hypothetical protein [Caudoviricetes sp.]